MCGWVNLLAGGGDGIKLDGTRLSEGVSGLRSYVDSDDVTRTQTSPQHLSITTRSNSSRVANTSTHSYYKVFILSCPDNDGCVAQHDRFRQELKHLEILP
jgi:hypothetical protein